MDLTKTATIHWVLHRLLQAGTIRRILRGIYDYPKFSTLLQEDVPPDIHQVALALARKFGWRIQPGGAAALNLIGISTQVPSRFEYLSDGPPRSYTIDTTTLAFKHQTLKEAGLRHDASIVLVQGLKELGQGQLNDVALNQMRTWLPNTKRALVLRDAKGVTGWVYDALKRICREDDHG